MAYNRNVSNFLIINSDLIGYLTVQMIINNNCFINTKYSLFNHPEC